MKTKTKILLLNSPKLFQHLSQKKRKKKNLTYKNNQTFTNYKASILVLNFFLKKKKNCFKFWKNKKTFPFLFIVTQFLINYKLNIVLTI